LIWVSPSRESDIVTLSFSTAKLMTLLCEFNPRFLGGRACCRISPQGNDTRALIDVQLSFFE
jgi:hypothetical protein